MGAMHCTSKESILIERESIMSYCAALVKMAANPPSWTSVDLTRIALPKTLVTREDEELRTQVTDEGRRVAYVRKIVIRIAARYTRHNEQQGRRETNATNCARSTACQLLVLASIMWRTEARQRKPHLKISLRICEDTRRHLRVLGLGMVLGG
jgi:hypothetical protein